MSPRGCSLHVWPVAASSQEVPCILVLEPTWHDDVVTVASLPLGVVVVLIEEPTHPVAIEEGSEHDIAWSTRCGAWCAKEALLLGGTCLRVIANSLLRHDGWHVHCAGLGLGSELGLSRHGARQPPDP